MKKDPSIAPTNRIVVFSLSIILFCSNLLFSSVMGQNTIIQLYPGAAPGSKDWSWNEQETKKNPLNQRIVYNVTHPSLTTFFPDSVSKNATAVIVCPGGGFHILMVDHNGTEVAKELNRKGIVVFLLKYRLVHSLTDDPWKEMMSGSGDSVSESTVLKMAEKDAENAMIYIRRHAAEFGINPRRIGIMGFSSGGALAGFLAFHSEKESRPDFVASIYGDTEDFEKTAVPEDAAPLFIAAATDDQFTPVSTSVNLYTAWLNSKHLVELHLYAKGKHGLVGFPADSWIIRFEEWLASQSLVNSK
jgi:dienelactone hydrolase